MPEGVYPARNAQLEVIDPTTSVTRHTGEVVHSVTDVALLGRGHDLEFTRTYRSQVEYVGAFGPGWTHSYDQRLWVDGSGTLLHLDGARFALDSYPSVSSGPRDCASPGVYRKARSIGTNTWEIRDAHGNVWRFLPINASNTSGKLDLVTDPFGNQIVAVYDGSGQLSSLRCDTHHATTAPTRRVDFTYDSGRIAALVDVHGSRTWSFKYTANGELSSVSTPAVPTLVGSSTVSASRKTSYTYEASPPTSEHEHNLESVTYPGATVAGLEFTYDEDDHVSQVVVRASASGTPPTIGFKYNAVSGSAPVILQTQVTDRLGHARFYFFDANGHARSIVDALGHTTAYEYNADGEATKHVMPLGNERRATYRSSQVSDRFQHGNVAVSLHLPASGAPGSQASYRVQNRYEPIYNQPLSTQDQGGTAIFDYEEDPSSVAALIAAWGIQTPAITALGDVNGDGITTQGGGKCIQRSSAPITKGLPTGVTGPVTRIETWTYDAFGRVTSFADPEGALTTFEYDGALVSGVTQDVDPDPSNCPNNDGAYLNSGTERWTKGCDVAHVEAHTEFERDARGNVVMTTDARGVQSTYQYNALDELVGSTIGASYDAARLDADLAALVSAGYEHLVEPAIWSTIEYDAAGNIVRMVEDNRGTGDSASPSVATLLEHDLEGRLTRSASVLVGTSEAVTTVAYDANGNQIRVVDPMGSVDAFVYDVQGQMTEVRRGAAANGSVLSTTAVTVLEYDANGRKISAQGPEDFDGDGHIEETLTEYDGRNRVLRTISPVGTERLLQYDSSGQHFRTDVLGKVSGPSPTQNATTGNALLSRSEFERDEVGATVLERRYLFALGQSPTSAARVELSKRDRLGRVVESVDAASETVTTVYDGVGRVIEMADAAGSSTRARYDAGGYQIEIIETEADPYGGTAIERSRRQTYDGVGRLIRTVSGGEVEYFAHDAHGNVTVRADGRSAIVQADPLGLYTDGPISNPGNTTRTTTVRTISGLRLRTHSDVWSSGTPSGTYAIWASGLDPSLAPSGAASTEFTTIQYDKVGNVTSVVSAGNRTMSFTYDAHQRMTLKQFPDGSSIATTYWRDGSIRTHSLRQSSGAVFRTLETHYDAAGRTRQVALTHAPANYAGTDLQTYEWNGLDHVSLATDDKVDPSFAASVVTRTYDSVGRILTDTQNGRTVAVEYGPLYESRFEFPDGRAIERTFDAHGRIDSILDVATAANIADYTYYGAGPLVAEIEFGNGTRKSYRTALLGSGQLNGYSASGRPLLIEHKDPGSAASSAYSSAYDAAGNRWLRLRQIGSSLTGDLTAHDHRQRVKSYLEQVDATTQISKGYLRDAEGNWSLIGLQLTPNAASLYTFVTGLGNWVYDNIAGKSLDHDLAGNRVRDAWFDYEYDAFDRLVRIKDRYDDTLIAQYSYDSFTRRIEKHDWIDGTVSFVYDGPRLVEVRDSGDQVLDQYVHGAALDELVQWTGSDGKARYFLTDEVGSVVGISDSDGTVIERYSYEDFGAPTFRDGAGAVLVDGSSAPLAASPLGNRFLFQGREYDSELALWRRAQVSSEYFAETPAAGQYNFRFRYANPEEGRFTSRDPYAMANNTAIDPSLLVGRILSGESDTPYEMHRGNPIDQRDPWGLSTITVRDPSTGSSEDSPPMPDAEAEIAVGVMRAMFKSMGKDHLVLHRPCPDGDVDGGGGRGGGRGSGPGRGGQPGGGNPGGGSTGGGNGGGDGDPGSGWGRRGRQPGGGGGGGSGGGRGNGLVPDPQSPGNPGKPGDKPGGGRGGLIDKVMSAAEAAQSDNAPLHYLLYCINPAPMILEAVILDLEEIAKKNPGLPQPGAPKTGAGSDCESIKLFHQYLTEKEAYKKALNAGKSSWRDLLDKSNVTKDQGRANSCRYFSRLDLRAGGGPNLNQDCREAWAEQRKLLQSGSGTKTSENSVIDKPGTGIEVSQVDSTPNRRAGASSPTRKAALERFDQLVRAQEKRKLEELGVALAIALSGVHIAR